MAGRRTSGKPRRTYDPERSQEALMAAAVQLFGEQGFHGTSMQELVEAAGLTKGAFYHHFESKQDLLHLIHDEFIDQYLARQQEILARFQTPHEQLYHIMVLTVTITTRFQPYVEIFFRERNVLTGKRFEHVRRKRAAATDAYRGILKRGVSSGEFRADINPETAALGLLGLCVWTYQWFRPTGGVSSERIAHDFGVMGLHSVSVRPDLLERVAGGGPAPVDLAERPRLGGVTSADGGDPTEPLA